MSGFDLALCRLEAGHKLRFYQDYYGRQWVKVHGGWRFWRNARIYLRNEEMLELKRVLADRRAARAEASMRMREADAA
jgi:hypothetical protein